MTRESDQGKAQAWYVSPFDLWMEWAERGREIAALWAEDRSEGDGFTIPDPGLVSKSLADWWMHALAEPAPLISAMSSLPFIQMAAWESVLEEDSEPVDALLAELEKSDRRFKDEAWDEEPIFKLLKRQYLLTALWANQTVKQVDGLDEETKRKVEVYTRQIIEALSPSNFVASNPVALKATLDSKGENLRRGFENLLADMKRGRGRLDIAMTDYEAFEVGKNLATTPGKVIYQNELMQLIQYEPTTETVYRRPLLIVPPWINKFYILDMKPKNSFIKWAVAQGHTVFVISWVNPGAELADKTFEDYMLEGPLEALEVIEEITGEPEVNAIGYCIGGTLTAATVAYLTAKDRRPVTSLTYFTTLVDFAEPGDLGIFIEDEQLALVEEHMRQKGYLEGHHMATVFNLLRPRDLIWPFVVNNYLLGRKPMPFDLLYWNSDSTRMPAAMHSFYLRKMYQENLLVEPGGIELDGVPIDLRKVETPTFMLSTKEDHIAPWTSTYAATQLFSGPVRFVLAASGHIAGVVNPPAAGKYSHWIKAQNPKDPMKWLAGAKEHPGSWWPEWYKWLQKYADKQIPARTPGDGKLKVLEDAPGSYVAVKAQD